MNETLKQMCYQGRTLAQIGTRHAHRSLVGAVGASA